jgi:hypothetical protein
MELTEMARYIAGAMYFVFAGIWIGLMIAASIQASNEVKWQPVTGFTIAPLSPAWPGAAFRTGNMYRWEYNSRGELRYTYLGKSNTELTVHSTEPITLEAEPRIHQDGGGGACLCVVSCDCQKPCRCTERKTTGQKLGEKSVVELQN